MKTLAITVAQKIIDADMGARAAGKLIADKWHDAKKYYNDVNAWAEAVAAAEMELLSVTE